MKINKKLIFSVIIIVVVVVLYCYLERNGYLQKNQVNQPQLQPQPEPQTQIANPASAYCIEQGGKLEIRTKTAGEYGVCIFDDGSECDEWKFFRGECKKSEKICKDLCGDGICQEIVCLATGCPCAETKETCPEDCGASAD